MPGAGPAAGGPRRLRLIYHQLDDRIRVHGLLYGLALLLIRVAEPHRSEVATIRDEPQRVHQVILAGPPGHLEQIHPDDRNLGQIVQECGVPIRQR